MDVLYLPFLLMAVRGEGKLIPKEIVFTFFTKKGKNKTGHVWSNTIDLSPAEICAENGKKASYLLYQMNSATVFSP